MWLAIAGRYLSAHTCSMTALAHNAAERYSKVGLATDMVGCERHLNCFTYREIIHVTITDDRMSFPVACTAIQRRDKKHVLELEG
jgi:hypothetical protein